MKYEYFVYDIGQTFYILTTKKTTVWGLEVVTKLKGYLSKFCSLGLW
jgi:hypothetical protein